MNISKFSLFALLFLIPLLCERVAASPNGETSAVQIGGRFVFNIGGEPNTLHPLTAMDVFARRIHELTMDCLADYNPNTYVMEPHLAERWEISQDNKEFVFYLRKNAKFHDGRSVTAEDVKFSFDAIFEPKYDAISWRPFFENIEKVEVVDEFTVKFTAKNTYYKNFEQLATMFVLPKHIYGKWNQAKKMQSDIVGAGPYKFEKYEKGESLILRRFADWYGFSTPEFKGLYNFEEMVARFEQDENKTLEMLKKGELDFTDLRAEVYHDKAKVSKLGPNVQKVRYENSAPKSWYFYGWNNRHPFLKSQNVRLALSYLMNREAMNQKYLYGLAKLAVAPMWYQSVTAPRGLKPIPFDSNKAKKLLKQDGWTNINKKGLLEKVIDGEKRELKLTLLYSNRDYEKYHNWYKDDLKAVGIELELKYLDWKQFEKALREGNFDGFSMAWAGGDQEQDPKQIWHSSSANGGSNFVGYNNAEVDRWIDEGRLEVDRDKRIQLFRKVYEKIAEEAPYTFWFNTTYGYYGVNKRIQRPTETEKYKLGFQSWWIKN